MAAEPHQSREGEKLPQDGPEKHSSEFSSSLTHLPRSSRPSCSSRPPRPSRNRNPRTPTLEELLSAVIDAVENPSTTPTSVSPLNRKHQRCLIEMEARHDSIVRNATTTWDPLELMRVLWLQFKLALCTHMIRCWIVIYTGLYLICWYYPFIAFMVFICLRHYITVFDRLGVEGNWVRLKQSDTPHYVLIVCGSGGHTGEMIRMMDRSIAPHESIYHRRYAIGYGDQMSYDKVMGFERTLVDRFEREHVSAGTFDIEYFHRGRHVHQSWMTTPFTALACITDIFRILTTAPSHVGRSVTEFRFPGVIVTDGPGSGFLFLLVAHWLKMWFIVPDDFMKTVFIESWARVNSISLTGKLIDNFYLADVFIAQYKNLSRRGPFSYADNMVAMPTHPHNAV
ncbi:glycosyltransferase family 1 protein [Hypoxylon sp. EC38]|nr:glycosyltransferase family 1 protein [Hypoxylon sp. EC38]